jgi:hypothetical protein
LRHPRFNNMLGSWGSEEKWEEGFTDDDKEIIS